jgi:ABC-type dipeptide/oligopeptide/nickel transport system permease component
MIPVSTSVGMMLGFAMTGTIIVETIFNIPGLGTLLNTSVNMYDYNLTQGIAIVCATIICGANLLTDLAYALLDPRIKSLYVNSTKKHKKKAKADTAAEGR